MTLLRLPEPYDFTLSTSRYRSWGRDAANVWEDDALWRAVDGREVRIAAAPGGVDVEPFDDGIGVVVRKLLGADFQLEPFYAFAANDPVLARIVPRLRGLRPALAVDAFEALVSAITAQQVSLHAAFAVRTRFIERFGVPVGRVYAFPSVERVAAANEDELLTLGFSRRKAEYVLGVARAPLPWDELALLPDDEVKARIVSVRGLGEWTADWFLARFLARPRAWPAGDLGLRKAAATFYGDVDVRTLGERFDPFQNLTTTYLLAGLYSGVGA